MFGMAKFLVVSCVDGDTFDVEPRWFFKGLEGTRIRPSGYNTPERNEPSWIEETERLERLILGKEVELEPITLSYGRLLSRVSVDGKPLEEFFPSYQSTGSYQRRSR